MNIAVILAGGVGQRVGAGIPKQFIDVLGKPVLAYAIEPFEKHPDIDGILVVCVKPYVDYIWKIKEKYGFEKIKWVTEGGSTFQESMMNGVSYLEDKISRDDIVLFHFGASPFISDDIITDVIKVCREKGTNAISATDYLLLSGKKKTTTSVSDPDNFTDEYINRDTIAVMNTPHAFRYGFIEKMYKDAVKTGIIDTVEPHTTTLMYAMGIPIYFSKGSQSNIKITTKEDLDLFEGYVLQKQKKTYEKPIIVRKPSADHKTILVTGSPGFIGSHFVRRLIREMDRGTVISLDSMNDYYDPELKEYRLREIEKTAAVSNASHIFIKGNIADKHLVDFVFSEYQPSIVVNLAAQAGVRFCIDHPDTYIESNIIGFYNILEACRYYPVEHLVFASSSSIYGGNQKVPYSTDDKTDTPYNLYAATKKSNELLAHAYAKLYNIPCTGLRFFTVYGPGGRPDMFYYSATEKLLRGETIQIFNYGNCKRDFTYIDDIVEGIIRVMQRPPEKKDGPDGLPVAPFRVYNIGGGNPENLLDFVDILQKELVRAELLPADYDFEAHRELVPMQPGDVPVTYADSGPLERDFGFTPKVNIREGLRKFVEWYKEYSQSEKNRKAK